MARDHRAEFTDFASARQRSLLRAAYLMVGDEALAQDLVQEALTKTYVAWPRLRNPHAAEAYTRKAITTTAITWFRKRTGTRSGSPRRCRSRPKPVTPTRCSPAAPCSTRWPSCRRVSGR